MKILLTGGSGMLGRNILEHPASSKYKIISPSSKELNLLDVGSIASYLLAHPVDMIIHCAGYVGGIHANSNDMSGFFNKNLLMGINIVNAAQQAGVRKLINFGTTCMYPITIKSPSKENLILTGPFEKTNEGYALAKVSVAKLCEFLSSQFGLAYKTLIPCNLYGRWDKYGDNISHMVPAVIKKIHLAKENNQDSLLIWGDGEARREFMLASECADATYFCISNFDNIPQYLNIGTGKDYTINEYYRVIADHIKYSGCFKHDLTKPVGVRQKLSSTTLLNSLGWRSKVTLEEGIKEAYEFFIGGVDLCQV